jgi:hypothetical protein
MRETLLAFDWDDPDDPQGNLRRIGDSKYNVTVREVEEVMVAGRAWDYGTTLAGLPVRVAWVTTGRWIAVVYDAMAVEPEVYVVRVHHAYEVDAPWPRRGDG